jgi:hypothetical protein
MKAPVADPRSLPRGERIILKRPTAVSDPQSPPRSERIILRRPTA